MFGCTRNLRAAFGSSGPVKPDEAFAGRLQEGPTELHGGTSRRSGSVTRSSNLSEGRRTRYLYVTENSEAAWKKREERSRNADQFLVARRGSGAAKPFRRVRTQPAAKCASAAAGHLLHPPPPNPPTAPCRSYVWLLSWWATGSLLYFWDMGVEGDTTREGGRMIQMFAPPPPPSCHLKNRVD